MRFVLRVLSCLVCVFMFYTISACSSSNTSGRSMFHGLDESQFSENPSLKASLSDVVALHLENPSGGPMEGDTAGVGNDLIPYIFNFFTPQNVQFCFQSDLPDTFTLLNSEGESVLEIQASNTCSSISVKSGNYFFKFQNSGLGDVKVRNFFVRQDPASSTPKVLINADCQNCDLSGIQMKETELSGHNFSGANFNHANLSDDNFRSSNLSDTSFLDTDLTGAIFDDDNSIFAGEQVVKNWVSGDGLYALRFTFSYIQQGQVPTISLTILDPQSQELYSQDFGADRSLSLDLSFMQGSFNVQNLHLNQGGEDAGVWGDICWGNNFSSCFHGVLVTFDSFDYYFNSISQALQRNFNFSSQDIMLNFINMSNDQNNSSIVIFQKNIAGFSSEAVAWKVIQYVGQGDNHPFVFPMLNYVGANDSYGNYTPQIQASPGQLFAMNLTEFGDSLSYAGAATSTKEIQLLNNLQVGSVGANIYKDGDLLATVQNVAPAQKAVFQFDPTIWIGPLNQIEQGQVMDSAILSYVNTQLSLLGVASADIVMTGSGTSDAPFQFNFENIVMQ